MKWLQPAGKILSTGAVAFGRLWQRLICGIFNWRRQWGRRRWPDYVVFTLEGELIERAPIQPRLYSLLPFFQTPVTFQSLNDSLRTVAADPDVRGVLFLVKGATLSLAQAQSFAALFARFHRWDQENNSAADFCPKEIVVYLEQASNSLCAMGAGADRLILSPLTDWNATGLSSEPTYLSDTLAMLGLKFDVVKVAPWKTAYDRYARSSMSEAEEEQLTWLLDGLYADLVQAIADGRSLDAQKVEALIDKAPLTAEKALAAGLIDAVAYEDQLPELLRVVVRDEKANITDEREARLLSFDKARRYLLRRPHRRPEGNIGVINLSGAMMPGRSRRFPVALPLLGDATAGSTTIQQNVRAAMKDESLAAVVLHVDSGGGSALASDLMWREFELLARRKPLVVYMGNIAASGGYYVATAARHIVAQSATLTGSIGVISGKPVTEGMYDKIQAHRYSLRRGENADIYTDQRAWEGKQRQQIEAHIDHTYRNFKERVARGRNLPYDELDPICSGKVWTGTQALAHGLVDQLGDFQVAVEAACQLADLPADRVSVTTVEAKRPLLPVSARQMGLDENRLALNDLAALLLRRDWQALLGAEHLWYLADGLPNLKDTR